MRIEMLNRATYGHDLRARPPRRQHSNEVGEADFAVAVEILRARGARSPRREHGDEVGEPNVAGAVDVGGTRRLELVGPDVDRRVRAIRVRF